MRSVIRMACSENIGISDALVASADPISVVADEGESEESLEADDAAPYWDSCAPCSLRQEKALSRESDHREREAPAEYEPPEPTQWPAPMAEKANEALMDKSQNDDVTLEYWRKTSGMHTVRKWCENYNDHPAGWGAMLMIHGIPEVTGRLRSKVESYGMYAALFVSGSISAIMDPPGQVADCKAGDWECELMKRIFFYGLLVSLVSHVLCIILAMAFVNALNEAARDADVIRMFAEGQGYRATVKCQQAFRLGAVANLFSVAAVAYLYLGAEVIAFLCVVCPVAGYVYVTTCDPLFHASSIIEYWRSKGHANDPYDLGIPVECMRTKADDGWDLQSDNVKLRERRVNPGSINAEAEQRTAARRKKPAQVKSKTMSGRSSHGSGGSSGYRVLNVGAGVRMGAM